MPFMNGVLYARQSLTRDGSESIPEQLDRMREAAERLKITVVAELVEAKSTGAFKNRGRDRAEWARLLTMIQLGQADAVIAYKSDRLSRGGGPGWAPLLTAAEKAGLNLDRFVATPNGWMSEFEIGIRATMDREESKKTSERLLDVRAREAKQGKVRRGRYRRFGYEDDCITPNPVEAALVGEATRRVLAGETPYAVVTDWDKRDIPTVSGQRWRSQSLINLLRHGHNAGFREHNGVIVGKGEQTPILDEDTYILLIAALRPRRHIGRMVRVSAVSGVLYCKACNKRLHILKKQSGTRMFRCRRETGLNGCGGIYITATLVENEVKERVLSALADPKFRKMLNTVARDGASRKKDDSIAAKIRGVEQKQERLIDLYEEGDLDKPTYRRRKTALEAELAALEQAMRSHVGNPLLASLPKTYDELVVKWEAHDPIWRHAVVRLVIRRIDVKPSVGGRWDPARLEWDLVA